MIAEYLDQVLAIERVSFPSPWERSDFLNEIYNNDYAYYYVCLVNGRVCGYAGLWLILDEVHITSIAVHPDWRRLGVGKTILHFLLQEASRLGADRVTLEVRVSNVAAQKLYERAGFTKAGLRKGYYNDTREDAIIMWKHLYGPEFGSEEY